MTATSDSFLNRHAGCLAVFVSIGMLLLCLAAYPWWDCPPPKHIYTWADVPPPPKDAEKSRAAHQALCRADGLLDGDLRDYSGYLRVPTMGWIIEHSNAIAVAWSDISDALQHLDAFDMIAPVKTNTWSLNAEGNSSRCCSGTHDATTLCCCHARLRIAQGDYDGAIDGFALLYSVLRKSMCSINDMGDYWEAAAQIDFLIAQTFAVLSDTNLPQPLVRNARSRFLPLKVEELSLRTATIAEVVQMASYFAYMNTNRAVALIANIHLRRYAGKTRRDWEPLADLLLFLPNESLRYWYEYMAPLMAATTNGSAQFKAYKKAMDGPVREATLRNWGGVTLINGYAAMRKERFSRFDPETIKVHSDLLAVRICQRLGESITLTDYFGTAVYQIDTNGTPYSVGPDGTAGLKDDVNLDASMDFERGVKLYDALM